MAERAILNGNAVTAERYKKRARELDEQAQRVRNLVLGGVGSAEEEATPEEPTSKEP